MPDCTACDDPDRRAQWGCDAPRPEPVWQIACECAGHKRECRRGGECDEGWRSVYRCPHAMARELDGLGVFLRSWSAWNEHGVLPGPGAFLDQPSIWVQAVYVADAERSAWERERQDDMRRQVKQQGAKRG